MSLKVTKEYGVTIKGKAYPLGAPVFRTDQNTAEVDALVEKGYVTESRTVEPAPKKDKGGK
jgi:hypothetical protein